MALKLKTAPTAAPVDKNMVKAHLRVDDANSDALIDTYIAAAVSYMDGLEGILGRAMVTQTWELYYDAFPADGLQIPLGPLIGVDSVEYANPTTGIYDTWSESGNWTVDNVSEPGWLMPVNSWPTAMATANAVKVTFRAGFGDETKVPGALKAAMLVLIADWFENREASTDKPFDQQQAAFKALVAPFRRFMI